MINHPTVQTGCTVTLLAATPDSIWRESWLISRNRSRPDEGVLHFNHSLARLLLGRPVGALLHRHTETGPQCLRIEQIEWPGAFAHESTPAAEDWLDDPDVPF